MSEQLAQVDGSGGNGVCAPVFSQPAEGCPQVRGSREAARNQPPDRLWWPIADPSIAARDCGLSGDVSGLRDLREFEPRTAITSRSIIPLPLSCDLTVLSHLLPRDTTMHVVLSSRMNSSIAAREFWDQLIAALDGSIVDHTAGSSFDA